MRPTANRSEFADHLAEMRHHWKVILLATLVAALAVFIWRSTVPETYSSATTVRLAINADRNDDGSVTRFQAQSLAELARTPPVVEQAIERSGFDLEVDETVDRVAVDLRDTPGFLEVAAEGATPKEAKGLADSMADSMVDLVANDPSLVNVATLTVSAPAPLPTGPVSPRPLSEAILAGLIVALLTAEGLIAWRKLRGGLSPVAPAAEVERLLGVPTLHLGDPGRTAVSLSKTSLSNTSLSNTAALPFVVQHLGDLPVVTVMQRGAAADARVAALLGRLTSGIHRRVLLVDVDLGRPVLHEAVGAALSPGLSEVLLGDTKLGRVLQRSDDGGRAAVVAAGAARPDNVTGRRRLVETNDLVRSAQADRVILSTTQNSSYDDALTAVHVFGDAVVLAVDRSATTGELRRLAHDVRGAGGNLAAVVVLDGPEPARAPLLDTALAA